MVLPSFELLARQPKMPNSVNVVARKTVPNQYGTPIIYQVFRNRKGTSWWVAASLGGMRMSNTLHTTVATKAAVWIDAVTTGNISVEDV